MTAPLVIAIVGAVLIGAGVLLVLFAMDRSGQPALRRYRDAHAGGRVLFDRTDGDRWSR